MTRRYAHLSQDQMRAVADLTAESATELALTFGFDGDEAIDKLRRAGLP